MISDADPLGRNKTSRGGRLFINATNVHSGGGAALLAPILRTANRDVETVALVDARMTIPADLPSNVTIRRVRPTIFARVLSDRWLASEAREEDRIFCFGNLPPLFAPRCKTSVFVQNRYLVGRFPKTNLSPGIKLRIRMERFWLAWGGRYADIFVVQTPSMERQLKASAWADGIPVAVAPFADISSMTPSTSALAEWDFLYVASREAHKNHLRLLEAWRLLAADGLKPSLRLTIDATAFPDLCARISAAASQYSLDVINLGVQPASEMAALYSKARAIIFPSTLESFGIPLIEARSVGLAVLASELDYVRDVVEPDESFDPTSALSIMRAVRRYLGRPQERLSLLAPADFMARIWGSPSLLDRPVIGDVD